jgi:hypothetical protein
MPNVQTSGKAASQAESSGILWCYSPNHHKSVGTLPATMKSQTALTTF